MKTLILAILILALSGPACAYRNEFVEKHQEKIRQVEEDNYRDRMLAIQEERLWLKEQGRMDYQLEQLGGKLVISNSFFILLLNPGVGLLDREKEL